MLGQERGRKLNGGKEKRERVSDSLLCNRREIKRNEMRSLQGLGDGQCHETSEQPPALQSVVDFQQRYRQYSAHNATTTLDKRRTIRCVYPSTYSLSLRYPRSSVYCGRHEPSTVDCCYVRRVSRLGRETAYQAAGRQKYTATKTGQSERNRSKHGPGTCTRSSVRESR